MLPVKIPADPRPAIATNYEGDGTGSGAAKGRADLEDDNGSNEHPFCWIELVDATGNGK